VGALANSNGVGVAVADLPVVAGTMSNPPDFACYLLYQISGAPIWVRIGDASAGGTSGTTTCVLGQSVATLRVVVAGGAVGQGVAIVVTY
jgi:hypothetical protein